MRRVVLPIGAFFIGFVAGPVAAQYRCPAPNGAVYQSSTPCQVRSDSRNAATEKAGGGSRSRDGVTYYGPAQSDSRYQQAPPSIGEAPAQLKYMSPRCSSLNDALRTAAARGLTYDTVSRMRKDYQSECAEDESEARGRLSDEMRDKSSQKREARLNEARERDRGALRLEQCGESKRILVTKRARTDLTEGEKAELQRFETNYKARC